MDIQIATWNVQTILKPGEMNEIGLEKEKDHAKDGEMRQMT
jgi:hypothetical protein